MVEILAFHSRVIDPPARRVIRATAYNSGESGGRRRKLPHLAVVLATDPRPPTIYSQWILHHNCDVSCQLMTQFRRTFKKIFVQSNMAARPWNLLIIREHPGIAKAWGTCGWSFPSICPAILEKKIFISFWGTTIWRPNHVIYDIIGRELFVPHG